MKRLHEFLKTARISSGLTQKDVSEKLDYSSAQFVSNWERGLASPPLCTLAKLVDMYSINPSELIEIIMDEQEQELRNCLFKPRRKAQR